MEYLDFYKEQERQRLEQSSATRPKHKIRASKEKLPIVKTINPPYPNNGMLKSPEKPAGLHYLSHQSVDAAHGIVIDVAVTPNK